MNKVLIIGAGGVGTVVAHKCAMHPEVFNEIVIASRTKSKCDAVAKAIGSDRVTTDRVDADSVDELVELFNRHRPDIVINVALTNEHQHLLSPGGGEQGVAQIFLQGGNVLRVQQFRQKAQPFFRRWCVRAIGNGQTVVAVGFFRREAAPYK